MKQRLARIQRTFIISVVGLVIAALVTLTGTLVVANVARYDQQVSANDINELIRSYPEVASYLDSQKPAEPHFVTIATLVKQNQERAVLKIVVWSALPIIFASALIGVFISRRLIKPVSDSYAAQERFIQDAAHELRNPLAAMSATIETAKLDTHGKKHTETIARLDRQTYRLIQINEGLLFLQRAAEPDAVVNLEISKYSQQLLRDLSPAIKDKQLTVVKKITPNLRLKIVPRDYEIVLRNLTENAIKYTPRGGKIIVSLKKSASFVELNVKDNGIGIPKNELSSVTKRFYRAKNANALNGTGLGLSLVQKVADAYKAVLSLESTDGKGTNVQVRFK